MAITGGIKFFKRSKNLFSEGTLINASSGDASSQYAVDKNNFTFWRSVGSDDLTTETITITFSDTYTIDRIFLIEHNWKDFLIKYYNGSSYVHFSSVVGINGSKTDITETAFSQAGSYYEFASVSTNSIQITVNKTQVANDEKYISQIICTEELGTLQGYPIIGGLEHDRNIRKKEMLSGKILMVKSEESFKTDLKFQNYPPSLSNDIDLMYSLHDLEEPFLIWLCGGRYGSNYFRKQIRGFRLQDIYQMQITSPIKNSYSENIYSAPVNFTVKLDEVID